MRPSLTGPASALISFFALVSAFFPAPALFALQQGEIPVVVSPSFVSAEAADEFLREDDLLLGVEIEGQAKVYPIRILGLYEVINDEVAGRAICATW